MYICVQLLNGMDKPLWYSVPPHLTVHNQPLNNCIVHVPIRNAIVPAVVLEEHCSKPVHISFSLKDIHAIEPIEDVHYFSFIQMLSNYHHVDKYHFIKRIYHFLRDEKKDGGVISAHNSYEHDHNHNYSLKHAVTLTDEQQNIIDFLLPRITYPAYTPTVIHGVTGSGKTEIYKTAFLHAFDMSKTTILLLPEITLAIAFEQRLKNELPTVPIYGFHSGKTAREKQDIWNNITNAQPMLLLGVHLPILLPIKNLGLIIVDEEHETGYQEKKHPKINSKEVALLRAHHINIPIILGSATPSINTLHNVKTKKWHFFQLKKRFSGAFPLIKTVSLTDNKHRTQFWISTQLEQAITDRLHKKEQTIIFLNRRGFSFFVQCTECSFIFECTNCSVSLTLHEDNHLICHYCGMSCIVPEQCVQCKQPAKHFLKKGIGTQRVVTILQKMFPCATIARADLDTTTKKKTWQQTIAGMYDGTIDILVGTQTVTKGFHFPRVTLVGIIWADLNLHFPVFNAAETTLQQLIQVAGRAGRSTQESTVIVQAMAEHSIFMYINEAQYLHYYAQEIEIRKELGYPPYKRFAELELKHGNETLLEQESVKIAHFLKTIIHSNNQLFDIIVLGPAKPSVAKIKEIHHRKIYLKGSSFTSIVKLVEKIEKARYKSSIFFTPNPVQ